ncbi:unnamed protein product [Ectocarpus sp. 12 AP-2014]
MLRLFPAQAEMPGSRGHLSCSTQTLARNTSTREHHSEMHHRTEANFPEPHPSLHAINYHSQTSYVHVASDQAIPRVYGLLKTAVRLVSIGSQSGRRVLILAIRKGRRLDIVRPIRLSL